MKSEILKFEIDEIWRSRDGSIFVIVDFQMGDFPVVAEKLNDEESPKITLTKYGRNINNDLDSDHDLIECIGPKKDYPEYFL